MVTSMLLKRFRAAASDEEGAVTVDWVVLSAAVVGLGVIVLVPIAFETNDMTDQVADYVANVPVGYGDDD